MTNLELLKKNTKQIKKLREIRTEDFLFEGFQEATIEFFEKNPIVYGAKWTQYTPYFNDGEACTFSWDFEELYFQDLENPLEYTEEEIVEEGADIQSNIKYDYKFRQDYERKFIKEVLDLIEEHEMELVFGEHSEVIVTKDFIIIKEYDHD